MEDRRAQRRNLSGGTKYDEYHIPANRGIPAEDGIPDTGIVDQGVPVEGTGPYKYIPTKRACVGKEGTCKAAPLKEDDVCVAHKRQRDASGIKNTN